MVAFRGLVYSPAPALREEPRLLKGLSPPPHGGAG
jgi:hypothetical protein